MGNKPAAKFKETLSDYINKTNNTADCCHVQKMEVLFSAVLLQNDQRGFSCLPCFDKIG